MSSIDIQYLTVEDIKAIHSQQIEEHGGSYGNYGEPAIQSAAVRPQQAYFGREVYQDLFSKAASYIESMIDNHPFVDGNKRTGAFCAISFLLLNGYEIIESHELELAEVVYKYESDKFDSEDVANYLANRARPL
ncbi:MAG: type II toxin-antitoxin system death-on-curing family toxin [Bacteroidota bacterium]